MIENLKSGVEHFAKFTESYVKAELAKCLPTITKTYFKYFLALATNQ